MNRIAARTELITQVTNPGSGQGNTLLREAVLRRYRLQRIQNIVTPRKRNPFPVNNKSHPGIILQNAEALFQHQNRIAILPVRKRSGFENRLRAQLLRQGKRRKSFPGERKIKVIGSLSHKLPVVRK